MPDNEQNIELKTFVANVFEKIQRGDAPQEVVALYQQMKPANFAFWLHGFSCAMSKQPLLHTSEIYRFLRKEMQQTIEVEI